jgi:hypothetical protein
VEGKAQDGAPTLADVRDVARAHILAAEHPSATGRYIVANSHSTPPHLISAWLQVCLVQAALKGQTGMVQSSVPVCPPSYLTAVLPVAWAGGFTAILTGKHSLSSPAGACAAGAVP